jgi:hypothetical protein
MKSLQCSRLPALVLGILSSFLSCGSHVLAQGTTFTYQGRLQSGGEPYTGNAEFQPTLWEVASGGTPIATNTPAQIIVGVTNGLFVLPLDFGRSFTGAARWLQLEVRTTIGPFSTLAPRQAITPAPVALHANSVDFEGIRSLPVVLGPSTLGSTPQQPLQLLADTTRVLRLEAGTNGIPNIIVGAPVNAVAPGVVGATISGGGAESYFGAAWTNFVGGNFSTLAGGADNRIESDWFSAIGGGRRNRILASTFPGRDNVIAGGVQNLIGSNVFQSVIAGGYSNAIAGPNIASSVILGGGLNEVTASGALAAGNRAKARHYGAFVWADTLPADFVSTKPDQFSVRAEGGVRLETSGAGLTVDGHPLAATTAGGLSFGATGGQPLELTLNGNRVVRLAPTTNTPNLIAGAAINSVAPGIVGATIAGGGSIGYGSHPVGSNLVVANFGTVGGGVGNIAGGNQNGPGGDSATVGGGWFNSALGNNSVVAGGVLNQARGDNTVIAGGAYNVALSNYATISGGSSNTNLAERGSIGGGYANQLSGWGGSIAGGFQNTATATGAVIGGGTLHGVNGIYGTVAGGFSNTLSGIGAVISGGARNVASEQYAVVPGGDRNAALGTNSLAAGHRAKANDTGAFVWADSTDLDFGSTTANQFLVRASGGMGVGLANPAAQLEVSSPGGDGFPQARINQANPGDYARLRFTVGGDVAKRWDLASRSNAFVIYSGQTGTEALRLENNNAYVNGALLLTSDRNAKENFRPVDTRAVLDKVMALPLSEWNYRGDDARSRHLGPVAQDFHAAFNLGPDDKHIPTVDADGVALAAIQGLNEKIETRGQKSEDRIQRLEAENAELKSRLDKLERLLLARPQPGALKR